MYLKDSILGLFQTWIFAVKIKFEKDQKWISFKNQEQINSEGGGGLFHFLCVHASFG